MTAPFAYRWTGEAMEPMQHFRKRCDEQWVVGEVYTLAEIEDRSMRSHRHYFVSVAEAWKNLPESIADQYPTIEHLRKKALIHCGYADERSIVCSSKAEALRVGAFIKPLDEYAVVTVKECVVRVYTAQTQSVKGMSREVFQKSKTDVLDYLDDLIGVARGSLRENGGRAA